jgi:uncharacterized membrane protein
VANEEPSRSLLWPAVLVGIGVAGSLDEIVLHQLLRWHHLSDRGSQAAGLIAAGIGIAEGHLDHVFDRFWRAPGVRGMAGSGLGLATSA